MFSSVSFRLSAPISNILEKFLYVMLAAPPFIGLGTSPFTFGVLGEKFLNVWVARVE